MFKNLIVMSLLSAASLFSCTDENDSARTTFMAKPATDITAESAVLNGKLTVGEHEMTDCGFVYGTVSSRQIEGYTAVSLGARDESGNLSVALDELEPGTTYYFRAFIVSDDATLYTRELSFTTEAAP